MNEKLSKKLKELAKSDKARSKSARLRDVYDDVVAAKNAGVPHQDIIDALAAEGLTFTYETFSAALYRIRKKRSGAKAKAPSTKQTIQSDADVNRDVSSETQASTDPKDLDQIFNNRPDLERYSKIAKNKLKQEKGK